MFFFGSSKKFLASKDVIPEKFKEAPVIVIGAGSGGDVDQRRSLAAEFGGVHGFLNFEFLNGIHRRADDQIVEVFVRHLDSIEQVDVMTAPLAAHVHQISSLLQGCAARPPWRFDDAFAEQGQLQKLPTIQGQTDNALMLDDLAHFGRGCAQAPDRCR